MTTTSQSDWRSMKTHPKRARLSGRVPVAGNSTVWRQSRAKTADVVAASAMSGLPGSPCCKADTLDLTCLQILALPDDDQYLPGFASAEVARWHRRPWRRLSS